MPNFVRHHKKYKEIHGVDEVVLMTRSEHTKLHFNLRQSGKCNVPVDELSKISVAAAQRNVLDCGGLNRTNVPDIPKIMDVLNNTYFASSRQIADLIDFPRKSVDLVLNYLYENGLIERMSIGTKNYNVWIYSLKFDSESGFEPVKTEYDINCDNGGFLSKKYTESQVINVISNSNNIITSHQIADILGCCKETVDYRLKSLLKSGMVVRVNVGTKNKKIWVYSRCSR